MVLRMFLVRGGGDRCILGYGVWLWRWGMIYSGGGGVMLYAYMPITGFVGGSLRTETEDERLAVELQGPEHRLNIR